MKTNLVLLLVLLILVGCQASGGAGAEGVVSNHIPTTAKFTVSTVLNRIYSIGQNIDIILTFPKTVTVTGNPELTLNIGGASKVAAYVSGDQSTTLTFRYTVNSGDVDNNGIGITNSINLNGGTLTYQKAEDTVENCPVTLTIPNLSTVRVDTIVPTVTAVSAPANSTYYLAQNLNFSAVFSESVVVTGTPRIAVDIGGTTKYATYFSGSLSNTLVFRYVITNADADTNGISISSPIDLNGGSISDGVNPSLVAFTAPNTSGVLVAGANPLVTSAVAPANATYTSGQNLDFTLTFNKVVTISGSPRLNLTVGTATRYATYLSGSGSAAVKFRYTVPGGDSDNDGISANSAIDLNGGSIQDSSANNAVLNWPVPTLSGVRVLSSNPVISSVSLPASPPATGYDVGETIDFTVNFSEALFETGNTSRLRLDIGGVTKYAVYQSGSGTATFVYRYSVIANEEDLNGITIFNPLELNGSTIMNASGAALTLTFTAPSAATIKVDARAPIISSNTKPVNGTYNSSQNLDFDVTYHEPVTVTGSPRIVLDIGGSVKYANYLSGSGSNILRFRYVTAAADNDADGISVTANIDLNSGSIADPKSHPAALTLSSTDTSGVIVDTMGPVISSVTAPTNGSYITGSNLNFTVNWSENASVTGTPRIALTIGSATRYATYVSGSGSNAHVYTYTTVTGDEDLDGIVSASPIDLNSGTISDAASNPAAVTFIVPDTSGVIVTGVTPVISSITLPANGKYTTGQNLDFNVVYSQIVLVTPPPRIALTIGSGTVYANYISGGGTNTLLFRYTVQSGDYDVNGLDMVSPLQLNGGAIQNVSMSQNGDLTFTLPDTTGITVDGLDPVISSVTPPANKTYLHGENLDFVANFTHNVTITGTPSIAVTIGGSTVQANYLSGSGTNAVTFRYTVASGNLDLDGIAISSPVNLNAGTIKDAFNDDAGLTFTSPTLTSVLVDGVVPTISSVTGPSAATYYEGQSLNFLVNFSEAVTITGTPRIQLTIGSTTKYASYVSGSTTTTALFTYVVETGDTDNNGIASASPIQLNSGTMRDASGNNVSPLTFTLPDTSGVNTDANGATITSVTAPASSTYKTSNNLDFIVNYSRAVDVTGIPRIQLTIGAATLHANYHSGSGTDALTFRYTVGAGDSDADGIAMASSIALNGGTIKDSGAVNAGMTFTAPNTAAIFVDGIDITISSVSVPADATYKIGDNLNFTVNFNYAAIVTGTPRIQLTVGAATLYANYTSGSGTTAHVYRYTVSQGDIDTDGITSISNIALNGGTIKDAFGDNAVITFSGANYPNKKVDGVRPTVSSTVASANKTYIVGENIDFTLTYSEAVTISGSPRIVLTVGATTRYATYLSGTGSTSIIFRYTVPVSDLDTNGIAVANSNNIDLNSGSIVDTVGNSQTTMTIAPPVLTGVMVDGVTPSITGITSPATYHGNGSNINFTVTFDEAVTVTGTPVLNINVGGGSKTASYVSGSGSSSLVFRYTTVLNDSDTDGVATISPLVLSGGTIKDSSGNNAVLTFSGSTLGGVQVDAVAPSVSSVTLPNDGNYQNPTTFSFTVNFNEVVNVTGSPQIVLTYGSTTAYASYASGSGSANIVFTTPAIPVGSLDLDGIDIANSDNISLNGGSIADPRANNAGLALGSTDSSGVNIIFPNMRNWYDVNDSAKITISGSNVTVLKDKIGTYDLTHSSTGAVYNSSGFSANNRASVTCSTGASFDSASSQASPTAVVSVMKAPASASTSQILFMANTTARPAVIFNSTLSGGMVDFGGQSGSQYAGGAWGSAGSSDSSVWTANAVIARAFWISTTQNRSFSLCKFGGNLSEFFMFTSQPTVAQMTAIQSYINTKYGLNFP